MRSQVSNSALMNRTPRVSVAMRGPIGILAITGDLTDSLDALLMPAYEDALRQGAKQFLLVFHSKSFINSAALRSILSLVLRLDESRMPVRACGFSPHIRHVFELVGLHHYVDFFPSESEALANWKSSTPRRMKPS